MVGVARDWSMQYNSKESNIFNYILLVTCYELISGISGAQ